MTHLNHMFNPHNSNSNINVYDRKYCRNFFWKLCLNNMSNGSKVSYIYVYKHTLDACMITLARVFFRNWDLVLRSLSRDVLRMIWLSRSWISIRCCGYLWSSGTVHKKCRFWGYGKSGRIAVEHQNNWIHGGSISYIFLHAQQSNMDASHYLSSRPDWKRGIYDIWSRPLPPILPCLECCKMSGTRDKIKRVVIFATLYK